MTRLHPHLRVRLKYRAHVEMGQSPPSANYGESPDDGLPFLQGTADFGFTSPLPKVYCSSPTKVAAKGDILFSVRAPVGELNVADQEIGIGRGLCAIRSGSKWLPRYTWWALHEARYQLNFVSTGSTYQAVAVEDVANVHVEDAVFAEQHNIADYLDRETARMDSLVAEKGRLLELLAEKRRTLIASAVTRGISPKTPLRDSGIPWLGLIPKRWAVKALKYVASLQSGETITADSISETGDYPVYGGNGLRGFTTAFTHDGSYVLIGRQGALCGNINFASGKFWASEHAIVTTIQGDDDHIWLGELLRIMNLNQYSQSAAQPGLSVDFISKLQIPVPPLAEQRAIVAHIAAETAKLDKLRASAEHSMALLKERRAALIAAAVTGKLQI